MLLPKNVREAVLRTCNRDYPDIRHNQADKVIDLLHGAVGLYTEFAEYMEADPEDSVNIIEELADMLWYIELIKEAEGIEYPTEYQPSLFRNMTSDEVVISMGYILDYAKKCVFYGNKNKEEEGVQKAIDIRDKFLCELEMIQRWLILQAGEWDTEYEVLAGIVIEKLSQRYPDKFTDRDALFRDLGLERTVLEDNVEH